MSEAVELQPPPPAGPPAPSFAVLSATHVAHAAAPTLRFELRVEEATGREVLAIALTAQVMIDPARRTYDPETRERLQELFGAPERWAATTHPFALAQVGALVPSFTGATTFPVTLPCTYDLDIAATKYFHGLADGGVPLSFHFTGTILYAGEGDRLQVGRVPWSCSAQWALPIDAWKAMMAEHYPGGGWVRLDRATLEALHRRRAQLGLPTMDAAVAALLD